MICSKSLLSPASFHSTARICAWERTFLRTSGSESVAAQTPMEKDAMLLGNDVVWMVGYNFLEQGHRVHILPAVVWRKPLMTRRILCLAEARLRSGRMRGHTHADPAQARAAF